MFHEGCEVASETWVANYWTELPPSFFCHECDDGGGGEVGDMSVDFSPETGLHVRGKQNGCSCCEGLNQGSVKCNEKNFCTFPPAHTNS